MSNNWKEYSESIAKRAWVAKRHIKSLTSETKNTILRELAGELEKNTDAIIEANKKDIAEGESKKLASSLMDRLLLTPERIQGIANSVRDIANLEDPVGAVTRGTTLPNGVELITKKVPIGVLLVIYESRPNVTIDVASLCFKSGNACILRGGKEALHSNTILASIFSQLLKIHNLPEDAVVFMEETDREILPSLLKLDQFIDIVVPRGGEGLIRTVTELSSISVVKHDKGVVNLFVDESADKDDTISIVLNSKVQRPGVCNALENLIIHENYPYKKELLDALKTKNVQIINGSYDEEFLDLRLSLKMVSSLDEAIHFINEFSSGHTETILSKDFQNIKKFQENIDSAGIFVNCSTRFHDGGQFGLGAEVGISTGKLHVRGPMGLEHLTTTTTYLTGNGHVR
ncbi:MAG: glutamate-5-semialdehyde dehydrogenase [Leptospira sp.]|nr:glutamate-5-semialdehyde dehydrogenase [Leptospira sp.]